MKLCNLLRNFELWHQTYQAVVFPLLYAFIEARYFRPDGRAVSWRNLNLLEQFNLFTSLLGNSFGMSILRYRQLLIQVSFYVQFL